MAARREGATDDCAYGDERCTACGACDYQVVDPIVFKPEQYTPQPPRARPPLPEGRTTLRLRYAKEERLAALSHLETMTAILRTFRRAGLAIPHTTGFNPKPRVAFGPACPVGTASEAEWLDVELLGTPHIDEVAEQIRRALPPGFALLEAQRLLPGAVSLNRAIRGLTFRVALAAAAPALPSRVAEFLARERVEATRLREGKAPAVLDLRAAVLALEAEGESVLRFTLRAGEGEATARPAELLAHLLGEESARAPGLRIVREAAIFGEPVICGGPFGTRIDRA